MFLKTHLTRNGIKFAYCTLKSDVSMLIGRKISDAVSTVENMKRRIRKVEIFFKPGVIDRVTSYPLDLLTRFTKSSTTNWCS